MPEPQLFAELKNNLKAGAAELSLSVFGEAFAQIALFNDLKFNLGAVNILSEAPDSIRIKGNSKDLLFKNFGEGFVIEAEFRAVGGKIEIVALGKFEQSPKKISDLPGTIGDLLTPLDFIAMEDMVFVLTTRDLKTLKSEHFPLYNGQQVNFKPGINLAAFLNISSSGNMVSQLSKPLRPIIGDGPYFVGWNLRDAANIEFRLDIPNDIDIENIFKLKKPALVLKPLGPYYISLDGLFEFSFPAVPSLSCLGGFSWGADGVRGKFNLDNVATKIPAPFGYPGVHLTTLTVHAGISNGVPHCGAEGSFYIGPNKPQNVPADAVAEFGEVKTNEFKVLYNAVPGKVTPYFCYLYLDKLTIEEYIRALSNQNISLPSFLGKILLEQVMFHWCENPVGEAKPDGTIAMPVFGFSSIVNVFGLKSFSEIQVDVSGNSKGKFVSDPIDLGGVLRITGSGKGTPEKYKGSTRIKPGGLELAFSSTGDPAFISFSGKVEALGLAGEIEGQVTDAGLSGKVKSNVAGIIKNDLALVMANSGFDLQTSIDTRISGMKVSLGTLGNVIVNAALQGSFQAVFKNDNYANSMRLGFEFLGIKFDLGTITVQIKDLKNIVKELEEFIRKQIIEGLTREVLKWLTAVLENVIEFAGEKLEQVGKALKDVYNKSLDESSKLLREAGFKAKEAGEALIRGFQNAEQDVSSALKKAGYLAEETGEFLKDYLKKTGEQAAAILQKAGYTAEEIGRTLKNVYGLSYQAVGVILKTIGASAEQVARVLTDAYNLTAEQIGNALKSLDYTAEVASAALKALGKTVEDVNKVLIDVYKVPADAARKVLESVGYTVKDITERLPHLKAPELHVKHIKAPEIHVKHVKAPHLKHLKHLKVKW